MVAKASKASHARTLSRLPSGALLPAKGHTYHKTSESRQSARAPRSVATGPTPAVTADWYEHHDQHVTFSQPVSQPVASDVAIAMQPANAGAFQSAHWQAYCELVRASNIMGAIPFTLVGAICATHSLTAAISPNVWAIVLVTLLFTWGGNALNDYYDFESGTDVINAPTKPLPRGAVSPDKAVLAAAALFIGSLCIGCGLRCPILRLTIVFNTFINILYTPVLKPIPIVKTVTVSYLVASSPLCAALAAGGGTSALLATLPLTGQLFGLMCYWQIIKDVRDVQGDTASGISTLPAIIGSTRALAVAVGTVLASTAAGLAGLAHSRAVPHIAAALSVKPVVAQLALQSLLVLSVVPVLSGARKLHSRMLRLNVGEKAIEESLSSCYTSLMMGLTVLVFV